MQDIQNEELCPSIMMTILFQALIVSDSFNLKKRLSMA